MASRDLVFTSEAARLLEVSPETVRLWERAGKLTALRVSGGVRLFERSEIEKVARERATGAAVSSVTAA